MIQVVIQDFPTSPDKAFAPIDLLEQAGERCSSSKSSQLVKRLRDWFQYSADLGA